MLLDRAAACFLPACCDARYFSNMLHPFSGNGVIEKHCTSPNARSTARLRSSSTASAISVPAYTAMTP
jgi:hypothetical protein